MLTITLGRKQAAIQQVAQMLDAALSVMRDADARQGREVDRVTDALIDATVATGFWTRSEVIAAIAAKWDSLSPDEQPPLVKLGQGEYQRGYPAPQLKEPTDDEGETEAGD